VVELLAQGRISPRRASLITFALSLMLRSVIVQDRQAANASTQVIFDAPGPKRDDDQPASGAQSGNSADAMAGVEAREAARSGARYHAPKTYSDVCT
jgi:hypothetical protein